MRDFVSESELARVPLAESCKLDLPTHVDPVLDTLVKAREIVARGWCQCLFDGPGGDHCIEGALKAAGVSSRSAVHEALIVEIPAARVEPLEFRNINLMLFNDHPDTSKADVLALFDRAIASRKAEG